MTKLVFDIETIGKDWADLDEITQKYFIEKFENKESAIEKFALIPSVAQIVAIGLHNPVSQRGGVLLVADLTENEKENLKKAVDFDLQIFASEKELLQSFWEISKNYREFITFAGNLFDVPFLLFRSAVHRIKPSLNLYRREYHIDLLEKFRSCHPKLAPSLHLLAHAFDLPTPKSIMSGKTAPDFYRERKFLPFVQYAYQDVLTTSKIYDVWSNYLNFGS